jgi:hypothetical protein
LTETEAAEILRGKDFVQLKNGPFDLDLVFAPDGIEHFEDAWRRRIDVEGFPASRPSPEPEQELLSAADALAVASSTPKTHRRPSQLMTIPTSTARL